MRVELYLCLLVFLLPNVSISQLNYNFFISNSGSDTNSGTSKLFPKRTITGTTATINKFGSLNKNVSVGLESGSIFNESLAPSSSIRIGSYNDSAKKNDFAILNGSDALDTGWIRAIGTLNTYQQKINCPAFSGNPLGNYSYVLVIEIDKQLEKIAPFTARMPLQFAYGSHAVDATPGSFWEPITNDAAITLFIHPSDNGSPNLNSRYRYEVTVRNRAIDGYRNDNNRFENLWVRGYGAGYGLIPSGANTYCNKIIFGPGAAIHHIVLKNGAINNSLFLPASKNINVYGVVFYDVEGFGRHNKISNSIFIDVLLPIYTHTSYGTNHGALELDNVIGFADTSQVGSFVGTSDNDTAILNNVYIDSYNNGYYIGNNNTSAKYSTIRNSYFKDAANAISYGANSILAYVNNVFIRSAGKQSITCISIQNNTSLNLTNTILHLRTGNNISANAGTFVAGCGPATNHISATGNIFICDVDPSQTVTAAGTNTNNGTGTSSDIWNNNVYILLKGDKILWTATNVNTNNGIYIVQTFDEWKKQSGQDQNSLFFDLRNDPRGLQAIFIDPDNGNYELANTVEGNQIKALQAGMTTPITCFLKKPSYEEAADLIKNNKGLTINSCRYPCQQTNVSLSSSTAINSNGLIGICPNQEQVFKGSGYYKQNDNYYHQSDLTSRYLWSFSDGTDTSGINLQSVTHRFNSSDTTNIRLQMVDKNGCSFDSTFKGILQPLPIVKLGADTVICKGLDLTLSTNYPGADYLWNTGNRSNSITVKDKGIYWVQATSNGCSFRDSLELKLQDCPCIVQMPNAFSPNGDGLNDVYKPVFGCYPTTFDLSVFDRNGQLVFKTKGYKNYWNGMFNGKPLPVGSYVYILNTSSESLPKTQQLHGSIILLR